MPHLLANRSLSSLLLRRPTCRALCGILLFLCCLCVPPTARAAPTVYELTAFTFGTVDLGTGRFNQLLSLPHYPGGMTEYNGQFYVTDAHGIYRLNTATGSASYVVADYETFQDIGSTTTGLYSTTNNELLRIDPTTGAITAVGNLGINLAGSPSRQLSSNGTSLFLTVTNDLYSINTHTGAATFVGDTRTANGAADEISGMVFTSQGLFGGGQFDDDLYQIDPGTGRLTFLSQQSAGGEAYGLAIDATQVPEPSTLLLTLSALTFLGMLRRFDKSNPTPDGSAPRSLDETGSPWRDQGFSAKGAVAAQ